METQSGRSSKQGIRAVAAHAGVSTASVSRALNRPDSVSAELRARIAEAVQSVGYIPHASARALSSRRTRTLGAIIPTIDNTMFARGIAALQKYLSSVGYMLFLTTNGYDLDAELEQAHNLISRGVDGLVLRGDCHHDALAQDARRQRHSLHQCRRLSAGPALPLRRRGQRSRRLSRGHACDRARPPPYRDRLGAPAQQRPRQRPRRRFSPRAIREWHRVAAAMARRGALHARRCARSGALSAGPGRATNRGCLRKRRDRLRRSARSRAQRLRRSRAICRSSASTTSTGAGTCGPA